VESRAPSGPDGLGREESERFRGEKVRRIRENMQRGWAVRKEEQSLCGDWDEKELGEGRGMFSPLLLLCPNTPTSSVLQVLLPVPPKLFAYSPRSGRRNQSRMGYHGKKDGGQECVGEGWE